MTYSLVLASASPRRKMLLEQLGVSVLVTPVDVDETSQQDEHVKDLVVRLAAEKARCGQIKSQQLGYNLPVLGADTLVVLDNHPLGKPASESDAIDMLVKLSNRCHTVMTAFCIVSPRDVTTQLVCTEVSFGSISVDDAQQYWHTGEPQDKAGSYAIQGLGAKFVRSINGSYSGVVGLPLFECHQALKSMGVC